MSAIGENLYTVLTASTEIAAVFTAAGSNVADNGAVEQNRMRQAPPDPRIWYRRDLQNEERDLDGDGGIIDSMWDVECQSETLDTAEDLAEAVRDKLDGYRGSFGTQTALGCFVEDHDDDYEPKGVGGEQGVHVCALRLQAIIRSD
jgi:hypothetical protein